MAPDRSGVENGVRSVDHLVWTTPDLELGVREIEALSGVRASAGGKHPSWGTHNALLALGDSAYLEILAPDPSDRPAASRLATWAAHEEDLPGRMQALASGGVDLGEILSGGRVRPDGVELSWRLTSPRAMLEGGVVPFLIDWGGSPHPSSTAARGLKLASLRAEHPEPERLRTMLARFGIDLAIERGREAALVAVIDSPHGRFELR
jgi:hypothetical protein